MLASLTSTLPKTVITPSAHEEDRGIGQSSEQGNGEVDIAEFTQIVLQQQHYQRSLMETATMSKTLSRISIRLMNYHLADKVTTSDFKIQFHL
ncbi:unnamed protein product [Protopolystoma xenopodis]|uniref:Uncharacterized protein n=1 Tax=Protopolystoma xenopodis TaxID=117903 RepID=A0A448WUL4_9PLAT|nr:unnamed protein product [Protopolystoma xenopodis]